MVDHGIRKGWFKLAPTHILDFFHDIFPGMIGLDGCINAQEVGRFRSFGIVPFDSRQGIRLVLFRWIQDVDLRIAVGVTLGHFAASVGQTHDAGSFLHDDGIGFHKDGSARNSGGLATFLVLISFAKQIMESMDDIMGKFQMLSLIFTDGNLGGLIQQDIGSHERWIGKEATTPTDSPCFLAFSLN